MVFQNTVVMDEVQMNSLTTPAINIQMSGLASHISVNDVSRITFNQTNTSIQGAAVVAGNLAVSNVLTASRIEATGSLPTSYATAGVYRGLGAQNYASIILNGIDQKRSQLD